MGGEPWKDKVELRDILGDGERERGVVSVANEWKVWGMIELTGGGVGDCKADRRSKEGHCPKNAQKAWVHHDLW